MAWCWIGENYAMSASSLEATASEGRLNTLYWFVFGLGLIWCAQLCLRSTGAQSDDEIGHYLLSRYSFLFPINLLDLWGRPATTLIYAVPALGGLHVARLFSLLLSAATVLVTTRLAALLNVRHLYFIPALLWFQPWFMDLGYSVLTEVPFTLFLTAATYFWAAGRYAIASCFVGLLPLTRDEGIALTGLWFIYMLARRNWKAAALAALPPFAFHLIFFVMEGLQGYAIYFQGRRAFFGERPWLHYGGVLRFYAGAPVLVLVALGLWPALRLNKRRRFFAGFLVYFAIHVVIARFGLFSSTGEARYAMPTAPALAIVGAIGVELVIMTWERFREWVVLKISIPEAMLRFGIGLMLVIIVAYGMRERPHVLADEGVALQRASAWLKENGLDSRPIVSTNVEFYYFHPLPVDHGSFWWIVPKLADLAEGTIVVWDRHYSNRWGLKLAELEELGNGWQKRASFGSDEFAIIFEKKQRDDASVSRTAS